MHKDEIPSGKPFYVFWIVNGGAEEQTEWLSEHVAYMTFRERVSDFTMHLIYRNGGEDKQIHFEIGVYNAEIEKTITRIIHMPS